MNDFQLLQQLSRQQEELISLQNSLQTQDLIQMSLAQDIVNLSKKIMRELRLLSLVRSKIIQNTPANAKQLMKSQSFSEINFSETIFFLLLRIHPLLIIFNFLLYISEKIVTSLLIFYSNIVVIILIRDFKSLILYF
jgi:hypothetical protein